MILSWKVTLFNLKVEKFEGLRFKVEKGQSFIGSKLKRLKVRGC